MIHEIDVGTGKKKSRKWTAKEVSDMEDARERDKPTASQVISMNLRKTEDLKTISNILEEVIDYIVNGTLLSKESKDWMINRKNIRN